jgi:hypothetical protein
MEGAGHSAGMSKLPNIGPLLRGPFSISSGGVLLPPSGKEGIVHGAIFPAHHDAMMPTNGGSLFTGDIDKVVNAVRIWNTANPQKKQWIRMRCEMADSSTAPWLIALTGPVNFVTSGKQPKNGTCCAWWSTAGLTAYTDWITKLGAYCDGIPEILECAVGYGGMYTAEIFIRWSQDVLAAWTGPGGALTCNKDLASLQTALDAHVAAFPNTYTLMDCNAHQDKGLTGTPTGIAYTKAAADHLLSVGAGLVSLTNASVDLNADLANLNFLQSYGPLGTAQCPISCQTLQIAQLDQSPPAPPPGGNTPPGTAGRTQLYQYIAGDGTTTHGFGISSCELPDTSDGEGDTLAVLTAFDLALKANAPSTVTPPPPAGISLVGTTWGALQSGGAGVIGQIGASWSGAMTTPGTALALPSHTLVVGATVVLVIGDRVSGGTTISTVTDALGNTWGRVGFLTHSPLRAEVWTCQVTVGGASVITITAAATSQAAAVASQWSGLMGASVDLFTATNGTAPAAPSASTSPAVTAASGDLVVGFTIAVGAPTLSSQAFTPAGTLFNVPDVNVQATGTDAITLEVSETLAGAAGAQQYSSAITGTQAWLAGVVTFQASTSATLTLPAHTITTGSTVLVSVGDRVTSGTTIASIADNLGNTWSLLAGAAATNGVLRGEVWRCTGVIGGSSIIVVTPVSTSSTAEARASEWVGLAASPLDKVIATTGTAPAAATGTTAATTVAGELIYATVVATGAPTLGSRAFTPAGTDFFKPDTAEQSTGANNSLLETAATLAGGTSTEQYSTSVTGAAGWVCIVVTLKGAAAAATAPGTPTNVQASAGDTTASVTWTPGAPNGAPTDQFNVIPFDVTTSTTLTSIPVTGSPPAANVIALGLTDGDSYTFTVTQHNSAGTSTASSPSAPVTPQAAITPPPPTPPTPAPIVLSHPRISARYAAVLQGLGE